VGIQLHRNVEGMDRKGLQDKLEKREEIMIRNCLDKNYKSCEEENIHEKYTIPEGFVSDFKYIAEKWQVKLEYQDLFKDLLKNVKIQHTLAHVNKSQYEMLGSSQQCLSMATFFYDQTTGINIETAIKTLMQRQLAVGPGHSLKGISYHRFLNYFFSLVGRTVVSFCKSSTQPGGLGLVCDRFGDSLRYIYIFFFSNSNTDLFMIH